MRSLVLVLVWPEAVWRCLSERPLSVWRILVRLVLPMSLACALALHVGLTMFDVDWNARWDGADRPLFGEATALVLFASWFGGTLAMATVFTLVAPSCHGRRDFTRSLNLAFFGMAPAWLASLAMFLVPAIALYPFALAWSGYLLFAGARILLEVGDDESAEFLTGSMAAMIVASGVWGLVLDSFAIDAATR